MQIIVKTKPEELVRARKWWDDLEMQWKFAYNEAVFGKGTVIEPPKDDELMILLIRADTLRFAGPLAFNPNMTVSLTNLSGLVPLYHLVYLSLTNTQITSLLELKRHTKLEHLFVYENKITSLNGIENMRNLKSLYFQHNQISDLSPIRKLTKLETLYASENKITKVEGLTLAHEENLRNLYLTPNEGMRDREVLRIQNEYGIIVKKG